MTTNHNQLQQHHHQQQRPQSSPIPSTSCFRNVDQQTAWPSAPSKSNRTQPNDCHSAILTYQQVRRLHLLMEQRVPILGRGSFPALQVRLRDLICRVTNKLRAKQINIRDIRLNGGGASYVLAPEKAHYNDLDLVFATDLDDESKYDVIRDAVLDCLRELHIEQHSTQNNDAHQHQLQQQIVNKNLKNHDDDDHENNIDNNDRQDKQNAENKGDNNDNDHDLDHRSSSNQEKNDTLATSMTRTATSTPAAGYQMPQLNDCAIKEAYVHKMVKVNDEDRWSLISLGVHQSEAYLQRQQPESNNKQRYINYQQPSSSSNYVQGFCSGIIDSHNISENNDIDSDMNEINESKKIEAVNPFDANTSCNNNNQHSSISSANSTCSSSSFSSSFSCCSSMSSPSSHNNHLNNNNNNHHHHDNNNDIHDYYNQNHQQQRQFPNSIELKFVDRMRRKFEFSVDSFQIILDSLMDFYHFAPQTTTNQLNMKNQQNKYIIKPQNPIKAPAQQPQHESSGKLKKNNHNNDNIRSPEPTHLHSIEQAEQRDDELVYVPVCNSFATNKNHIDSEPLGNRSESSSSGCSSSSSVVSSSSSSLSFEDDDEEVEEEEDEEEKEKESKKVGDNNQQARMSCPVISENFYPTVVGRSEYGNFNEALGHLEKKLIATRNPEQIRGGGLLKYCNLLVKFYKPTNLYQIRKLERYMCSRFFIDFCDLNQQQAKLESYLANHFSDDPALKFDYLTILHTVVQRSTVCLMNHELRVTLNMIRDLAYKLNDNQLITPDQLQQHYSNLNDMNNVSVNMNVNDHQHQQTAMILQQHHQYQYQQSLEMYNNLQLIQEQQQQQKQHQKRQDSHQNQNKTSHRPQNNQKMFVGGNQKKQHNKHRGPIVNGKNNSVANSMTNAHPATSGEGGQQTTVSYFGQQRPPVILHSGVYRVKMVIA